MSPKPRQRGCWRLSLPHNCPFPALLEERRSEAVETEVLEVGGTESKRQKLYHQLHEEHGSLRHHHLPEFAAASPLASLRYCHLHSACSTCPQKDLS